MARRLGAGRSPAGEGQHRHAVGGMWEQVGRLQFEFLVGEGLTPDRYLLDMGCGSLRGGIHFIGHLEPGHYFGVDRNPRLLAAGEAELERAGVTDRDPTLVVRNDFRSDDLGQRFDFAIAQSLFTHLPFNSILRCVSEVGRVLAPGGRFYATFFANPGPRLGLAPMPIETDHELTVHVDRDPFYYDPDLFSWLCEGSDLTCEYRGEWGHPRSQQMLVFTKRPAQAS